jgi:hypothetical protein
MNWLIKAEGHSASPLLIPLSLPHELLFTRCASAQIIHKQVNSTLNAYFLSNTDINHAIDFGFCHFNNGSK